MPSGPAGPAYFKKSEYYSIHVLGNLCVQISSLFAGTKLLPCNILKQ